MVVTTDDKILILVEVAWLLSVATFIFAVMQARS